MLNWIPYLCGMIHRMRRIGVALLLAFLVMTAVQSCSSMRMGNKDKCNCKF